MLAAQARAPGTHFESAVGAYPANGFEIGAIEMITLAIHWHLMGCGPIAMTIHPKQAMFLT